MMKYAGIVLLHFLGSPCLNAGNPLSNVWVVPGLTTSSYACLIWVPPRHTNREYWGKLAAIMGHLEPAFWSAFETPGQQRAAGSIARHGPTFGANWTAFGRRLARQRGDEWCSKSTATFAPHTALVGQMSRVAVRAFWECHSRPFGVAFGAVWDRFAPRWVPSRPSKPSVCCRGSAWLSLEGPGSCGRAGWLAGCLVRWLVGWLAAWYALFTTYI